MASRGNFGHPPLEHCAPQCSNGGWPKLPRLAKVTPVYSTIYKLAVIKIPKNKKKQLGDTCQYDQLSGMNRYQAYAC